ncbi:pyridoxamine 5'-phosphate oxidase [Clostridia bacterium]|nr:pyridoxamine 5'-phosphate oxidase [Clostridia bacterium]
MKEVYDFLKKTGTYYLATVEGDQPRVRPFGTINLFEDKLYIQTAKKKDIYSQLAKNPKAELSAFDGQTWIRIAATLVENNTIEAQTSMLDSYPNLKDRYQVGDENNVVYYLKDATATLTNFVGESKTIKF